MYIVNSSCISVYANCMLCVLRDLKSILNTLLGCTYLHGFTVHCLLTSEVTTCIFSPVRLGSKLAFKCLSNETFENLGGPLGWFDFCFVSLEFSCLRRCIFNLMGMLTPH